MLQPDDHPDDIEALRARTAAAEAREAEARARIDQLEAQTAQLTRAAADAEAEIERLTAIITALQRHRFGARSEKLGDDQLELSFEEIEQALARVQTSLDELKPRPRNAKGRNTNRGRLPVHLERIERIVDIDDKRCACCGGDLHVIGEDTSERLDVVPATFRVLVTRRPKYGCRSCEAAPVQAPAVPRIVEGGMPTEATIAQVVVSKYADHLPLYRQAQIYARQGVELDRSTLADWVGRAAWWLTPLRDHLLAELKRSSKLFADETTAPVLEPGRGRTKTGQIWAYARDDRSWGGEDPPAVAYVYAPDRTSQRPMEHLAGFAGVLQVDGYAGYNRLGSGNAVSLAFCWAHVRRGFFEQKDSPFAVDVLKRIAKLYAIEDEIRGAAPDVRRSLRQAEAKSIVDDLKKLLSTGTEVSAEVGA